MKQPQEGVDCTQHIGFCPSQGRQALGGEFLLKIANVMPA
jgi:hypothetical protein